MVYAKRQEKLKMRQIAIDRMNKMWGVSARVVSILDDEFIKQNDDSQQEVSE